MPIQFKCQKCSQWLEVDEPHAGGKAICPFCQTVNYVPKATPQPPAPEPQTPARPDEAPSTTDKTPYTGVPTELTRPDAPDVPVSEAAEKRRQGQEEEGVRPDRDQGWFDAEREGLPKLRTGWLHNSGVIGLALSIASVVLLVAGLLALVMYLPPNLRNSVMHAPATQGTVKQTQEQIVGIAEKHAWIGMAVFAALALNLLGLGISLATVLAPGLHRRRAAWAGVVIGGLLLVCICSSIMQQMGGMLTK